MNEKDQENDPYNSKAQEYFGIDYIYPYQRLVTTNVLEGLSAQIVILPTGAGKSLCFSLPALFLSGLTIIIYPLLSLMSDQKRRLDQSGISNCILKGGMKNQEVKRIFNQINEGRISMILTNPEWLSIPANLQRFIGLPIDHFVIDETHTVSEWGETFRPSFLNLSKIRKELSPRVTSAFTATASPSILKRIKEILFPGESPHIISANPDRPNLAYGVLPVLSKRRALKELCLSLPRPMVIFTGSRTETELTARELKEDLNEDSIRFYHAGLSPQEKSRIEEWFFDSRKGILTATNAYGMGVDKADIRTVIHRSPPGSIEAYLQESGRAGRDRNKGWAVLLYSSQDADRLAHIENPLSKRRYRDILNYAEESSQCRREQLLSLLGSSPEYCSGCDVCNGTALNEPRDIRFFGDFFKLYKRSFSFMESVWFLKGLYPHALTRLLLHKYPGFGTLSSWSIEEISESMKGYMILKKLKAKRYFLKD